MEKFNTSFFVNSMVLSYLNKLALLALGFVYVFILSNQLGPAEFGKFSYIMDVAGALLGIFGMETLCEVLTVFLPKYDSKKLVRRVVGIQAVISVILAVLLLVFAGPLLGFFGAAHKELFFFVVLMVLFAPVSLVVSSIATGTRRFKRLVALTLIENAGNVIFTVLFVFVLKMGMPGAIYGRVASLLVLAASSVFILRMEKPREPVKEDYAPLVSYSKQSFASGIFKKIGLQANLVYIGLFVSPAALGIFYLLQKISNYSINIPISAINETQLPFVCKESGNRTRVESLTSKSVKAYIIFSSFTSLFFLVVAYPVLTLFFPQFVGELALIPLFALYYLFYIDYSLGTFYRAINRPQVITWTSMANMVFTVVAGYFLIQQLSVIGIMLVMMVNRLVGLYIFVGQIKPSGYSIEFIPRMEDVRFILGVLKKTVSQKIRGGTE